MRSVLVFGVAVALLALSDGFILRGGGDAAAAEAPQEQTVDPEEYARAQMEYFQSLSTEQQEALLASMSPQDRANAEAFLQGKPTMTITTESLNAWKALSKEEQEAQLATMTPEQREAIENAVAGKVATGSVVEDKK